MTANQLLIMFNGLVAMACSVYMLRYGIFIYRHHAPVRRAVYVLIGLAMLYHCVIYGLALWDIIPYNALSAKTVDFTTLVRPLVSLYFLAPVVVDIIQRKYGGLKTWI